MNIASLAAPTQPLVQPPPTLDTVALPLTPPAPPARSAQEQRSAGDAQVAQAFAKTLGNGPYRPSIRPPNVKVHPDSTLARWYIAMDNALLDPHFQEWIKAQKLDTSSLTFVPSRGEITGYVEGKLKTFSASDDSGWSDVSRTLMSTLTLFAPEPGQEIRFPWYGRDDEIPANIVAQFYGEPVNPTPAQAAARLRQLKENPGFQMPQSYASARSEEALCEQEQALGDAADRHATITALKSQADDVNGRIDLDQVQIPIDPRSGLFQRTQRSVMSLADHLRYQGNKVPINSQQAHGLAFTLSFDLAHRAPKAESGGVVSLTGLLGATARRRLDSVVKQWLAQHADQPPRTQAGPGRAPLLNRLMDFLPQSTRLAIRDDPAAALDQLIRSPEALALGQAIQSVIKQLDSPTSASESVSAALTHELSAGADKSPFNLAGYNLYSLDNAGASHAEIVRRFTAHLETIAGVEGAPIAARLLFTAAAPELLVKDVPPNLVFGSHTWTNFAIGAARINQQVPGALANMTFSQVMAFADAPSDSLQTDDQLGVIAHNPLIAWGVANGIIKGSSPPVEPAPDFTLALNAFDKQMKELEWARITLSTPAPTRKALALAELKRVLPDIDPTLEVLERPWVRHTPVSLLDVYMTGPIDPEGWESNDKAKLPFNAIASRLSELDPDISTTFAAEFAKYRKSHENAMAIQFKYQLSLLPEDERDFINHSSVSFYALRRPFSRQKTRTAHGREFRPVHPEPYSAEDTKKLNGKHALLMRADKGNGHVNYYTYAPTSGKLYKVDGLPKKLPIAPPAPWNPRFNPTGSVFKIDDSVYFGEPEKRPPTPGRILFSGIGPVNDHHHSPDDSAPLPGTYFSKRNGTLGLTPGTFFTDDYDALELQSRGMTELEKGNALDENLKKLFLSLIPFYDGIQNAINGNVSGAFFEIGFDLLGFIIPGALAARKGFRGGKSTLQIIRNGLLAGAGESLGTTDIHNITKNLNKAAAAGYKDVKYLTRAGEDLLSRLKGHFGHYNASKIYKENDITKGFHLSAVDHRWHPTVAIFKKGSWYAYNTATKFPYGIQLAQFGIFHPD